MNWRYIWLLSARDVAHNLRDARIMLTLLLTAVIFYPIIIAGSAWLQKSQQEEALQTEYVIAVDNKQAVEKLRAIAKPTFTFKSVAIGRSDVADGTLRIKVENKQYTITWEQRSDRNRNVMLNNFMNEWIDRCNQNLRALNLQALGINPAQLQPIDFQVVDVTPEEQRQNPLTSILGYFMALGIIIGGMSVAIDTTTGEKERKTLLTLYSSPHTATEIMFAKLATVSFFSVLASILNLLSIVITLTYGMNWLFDDADLRFHISFITGSQLLLLLIPFAILLSCIMIAIGIYARTIKEATAWVTPLLFVVIFIGITWSGVDATSWSWMYWTPVINVFVAFKDALTSQLTVGHFLLTIAMQTVAIALLLALTRWLFKQESVLFRQ